MKRKIKIDIIKILVLLVLISSIIALSGCTSNLDKVSEQSNNLLENKSGLPPQDMPFKDNGVMNLSDAERQPLMEERKPNLPNVSGEGIQDNNNERPSFEGMQQKLLEACNGKKAGDSSKFTSPIGDETCTCNIQENQLICIPEGFKGDI